MPCQVSLLGLYAASLCPLREEVEDRRHGLDPRTIRITVHILPFPLPHIAQRICTRVLFNLVVVVVAVGNRWRIEVAMLCKKTNAIYINEVAHLFPCAPAQHNDNIVFMRRQLSEPVQDQSRWLGQGRIGLVGNENAIIVQHDKTLSVVLYITLEDVLHGHNRIY